MGFAPERVSEGDGDVGGDILWKGSDKLHELPPRLEEDGEIWRDADDTAPFDEYDTSGLPFGSQWLKP